jgi:arylsulfatase
MSAEEILAERDSLGGVRSWPHYPVGWAVAMDTPYQWVKQVASHYGGTRNGLIVHWPRGIAEQDGRRHQWHHVIDIAPTILEAADIPWPHTVDGIDQQRVDGVAMNYTFKEASAADRHRTQYFEIVGNRGIYHEGWTACAPHRAAPWDLSADMGRSFEDDRWELYDTSTDWTQARDLAEDCPDQLERLKQLFLAEASRNQALPLDDRSFAARRNAGIRSGARSMTFHPATRRLMHEVVPNVIGSSFAITARIIVPTESPAAGVICAQGGLFSGYSFYFKDGRLAFCMNVGDSAYSYVRSAEPIAGGRHEIKFSFNYDGGALGNGGDGFLSVDGMPAGDGRIQRTLLFQFPIGEDFNVGVDPMTPVTEEYPQYKNSFNGTIEWVRVDAYDRTEGDVDGGLLAEIATQ